MDKKCNPPKRALKNCSKRLTQKLHRGEDWNADDWRYFFHFISIAYQFSPPPYDRGFIKSFDRFLTDVESAMGCLGHINREFERYVSLLLDDNEELGYIYDSLSDTEYFEDASSIVTCMDLISNCIGDFSDLTPFNLARRESATTLLTLVRFGETTLCAAHPRAIDAKDGFLIEHDYASLSVISMNDGEFAAAAVFGEIAAFMNYVEFVNLSNWLVTQEFNDPMSVFIGPSSYQLTVPMLRSLAMAARRFHTEERTNELEKSLTARYGRI